MYSCFSKSFRRRIIQSPVTAVRSISSSDLAAALRPFYFAVHPDLFGRYPEKRAINENSLQLLSVYIESLQNKRTHTSIPSYLPFYVRSSDAETKGIIKRVDVPLAKNRDPKLFLKTILEVCNLPTEFVDQIKSPVKSTVNPMDSDAPLSYRYAEGQWTKTYEEESFDSDGINFESTGKHVKREEFRLVSWIDENKNLAHGRAESLHELKEEVTRLRDSLVKKWKVKEIRYDCGWNVEHYRGCLKSLERLIDLNGGDFSELEGRTLVFAAFTGVSLDGHIMLFTGDVHRNWLDLLRNVKKHDAHLARIPAYEYALGQVLRDIRIKRRKFMPKTSADQYTGHLRKLITTLLDFLSKQSFPKSWPESMNEFELVVESEAGPLMVSPTGQIITPASCPGFLFVDFITNHMDEANDLAKKYLTTKHVERRLHMETVLKLRLSSLTKDDSITPELMVECLERLLECGIQLNNIDLLITNYYSVLSDGTVCIPHDWKI